METFDMLDAYYDNKTLEDYEYVLPNITKELMDLMPYISELDPNIALPKIEAYITDQRLDLPSVMVYRLSDARAVEILTRGYLRPIFSREDLTTYTPDVINAALSQQRQMELDAKTKLALRYIQIVVSTQKRFLGFIEFMTDFKEQYNRYNTMKI